MEIYLLQFFQQKITGFVDLVFKCSFKKGPCILIIFQWNFPPMFGAHIQGLNMVKHVGYQGTPFFLID